MLVEAHRGYVNQGICVVCNSKIPWWQEQKQQSSSSSSSNKRQYDKAAWNQGWNKKNRWAQDGDHDKHAATGAAGNQPSADDAAVDVADDAAVAVVETPKPAANDGDHGTVGAANSSEGGPPSEEGIVDVEMEWTEKEWEDWAGEQEEYDEEGEDPEEEEDAAPTDDDDAEWARLNAKIGKMKGVVLGQFLHGGAPKQRKRMNRAFRANLQMLMAMCSKLGRCHGTQ